MEREEWLVSLATLLVGKPPVNWLDRDGDEMHVNLQAIARRFRALETVVLDERGGVALEGTTLLRVSIVQPGEAEQERVVAMRDSDRPKLLDFCRRMRDTVTSTPSGLPRETVLAGLAILTRDLMAELDSAPGTVEANP
jgi:hypothetical protein